MNVAYSCMDFQRQWIYSGFLYSLSRSTTVKKNTEIDPYLQSYRKIKSDTFLSLTVSRNSHVFGVSWTNL